MWFASRSFFDIATDYAAPNNHVFHNLLVHGLTRLFGSHPSVLRLPPLCAGVALVPATWWLCRRHFRPSSDLLAAAMMAAAPISVELSTQARGYTFVA